MTKKILLALLTLGIVMCIALSAMLIAGAIFLMAQP